MAQVHHAIVGEPAVKGATDWAQERAEQSKRHDAHLGGPDNPNHAARQYELAANRRQLQNPSTEPNRIPQQHLLTSTAMPTCVQRVLTGQVPDGQRIAFGP